MHDLHDVGGSVAATHSSAEVTASGASGDGLTTIVLPVARAGATLRIDRMSGAFHGTIAATTP